MFFINLAKEEYNSRRYKTQFEELGFVRNFKKAKSYGANILAQKKNGACFYLKGGKCSIHKTRPKSCRSFYCTSKNPKFKSMIKLINDYKK